MTKSEIQESEYFFSPQAKGDLKSYLVNNDSKINQSEVDKLDQKIPEKIYKYSGLNKYSLQNFAESQLSLSLPILFNDPYDSFFEMEHEESALAKLLTKNPKASPEEQRQAKYSDLKQEQTHNDEQKELGSEFRKRIYVDAFTLDPNNALMWPHYGDTNAGICVEYATSQWKYRNSLYPVIYTDHPVAVKYAKTRVYDAHEVKHLDYLIESTCKNNKWSYEQEWRSIVHTSDNAEQSPRSELKSPNITGIYLGPYFFVKWLLIAEYIQNKENKAYAKYCRLLENYCDIFNPFRSWLYRNPSIKIYLMTTSNSEYQYTPKAIQNPDYILDIDRNSLLEAGLVDPETLKYFEI
ncbi:DUF2971 domain-containing protein [Oenococcus oeni]